jgi:hypothetical protein
MRHIADVLPDVIENLDTLRRTRESTRADRIAEGVAKFGWPDGATCPDCGDTGKWPNSMHYCGCIAGMTRRTDDDARKWAEDRERRWFLCGVPRRFRGYRLDTAPDQLKAAQVRAWLAEADEGVNLLITGPVGTGKTGLAIGALWELHEVGKPNLLFQSVPSLLDAMRPGGADEGLMRSCQRAGVLVLDDIGAEKTSEWVRERLYVLINARYEAELPTIITTNMDLVGLASADVLGERTVSRLAEAVTVVALDGDDRRRG